MNEEQLLYRKDRFEVEVKPARYPEEEGEVNLRVTLNGSQWSSINLLKGEVVQVIDALKAAITKKTSEN